MNKNTIIGAVPAAHELHKVPGFDPMKHLRGAVNAQGEPVMSLEPRYQRLWFRLAYPNGRMLLNPLRITDQMAIFEAKVFFHREDATPASSFTANKMAQENADYIRAAQEEALTEALNNAGFGIQLCDVTLVADSGGEHKPSTLPAQAQVNQPTPPPARDTQPPVKETPAVPAAAERQPAPKPAPEVPPAPLAQMETVGAAGDPAPLVQSTVQEPEPVPGKNEPVPAPVSQEAAVPDGWQKSVLEVLNFPAQPEEPAVPPAPAADAAAVPAPADTALAQTELPIRAVPSYTDDTPMEEILTLMTVEEARTVMAPNGTCTGWTLGQVAEQRPSSLRFFLTSFCKCGNIQKAAATLLIQDLEQKKLAAAS